MKTCIIINPNAGSVGELEELEADLGRLPDTTLCLTEAAGDAERLARQAVRNGASRVIAAGGDGTVNEVLNGLAEDFGRTELGLIPLGTGNDFARSIGVAHDLEDALRILREGHTRWIDVVRARLRTSSRWFLNMSAGGFSGEVSEKASEAKGTWGPLAYLRGAVEALPELHGYHTVIRLPDERLELEVYNVVVCNGRYVASGIPVAPEARLDDGLLDVLIVPATTMPRIAALVPQVLLGLHMGSDLLLFRRTPWVEIESTPGMWFNLDGELQGDEPIRFEVLPRALKVVVGEAAAEEGTLSNGEGSEEPARGDTAPRAQGGEEPGAAARP
jgi:diacylglycerol kinase (ATP)